MTHERRRKRLKIAVTMANVHEAGARVQTAAMNWHAHSSTAKLPNITRSIAKSPEIRGFFLGCGTTIPLFPKILFEYCVNENFH